MEIFKSSLPGGAQVTQIVEVRRRLGNFLRKKARSSTDTAGLADSVVESTQSKIMFYSPERGRIINSLYKQHNLRFDNEDKRDFKVMEKDSLLCQVQDPYFQVKTGEPQLLDSIWAESEGHSKINPEHLSIEASKALKGTANRIVEIKDPLTKRVLCKIRNP
jgi:hypothetical protein